MGKAPSVSIIVPTYKEAENLKPLLKALERLKTDGQLTLEVLIMDDNSQDGSVELVKTLHLPWVQLITRYGKRGLSDAVIEGFQKAKHEAIVVMDADFSHPVKAIPKMLAALEDGSDFVIGSRYIDGATTDESWGIGRWLSSKVASLMAAPLTSVKDPMSGFFAFRRALLDQCGFLNPIGYKIGLSSL